MTVSERREKDREASSFEEIYVVLFRCDIIRFAEHEEGFLFSGREMILEHDSVLNTGKRMVVKEKEKLNVFVVRVRWWGLSSSEHLSRRSFGSRLSNFC